MVCKDNSGYITQLKHHKSKKVILLVSIVSDIAIFVLKRDVKLQLTNFQHTDYDVMYATSASDMC